MKVMGADARTTYGRTRRERYLRAELSLEDILRRLAISSPPGMAPEDQPPPDGKGEHLVAFYANGVLCAVWDYDGVRWSAFGPSRVFDELGWTDHSR